MRPVSRHRVRALLASLAIGAGLVAGAAALPATASACPAQGGVWHEDYIENAEWVQCNLCGQIMEGDEQYGHHQICTGR